jgi:hypothetical protein
MLMRKFSFNWVTILLAAASVGLCFTSATAQYIDTRCSPGHCQTIFSPAPDYGLVVAPPSPPGTILICARTDCRVMPAPEHLPSERHR